MAVLGTLLLSHSSRRTNLARCAADFLRRRFADPRRLDRLPPFASLPPARPLYSGALSLYRVHRRRGIALERLGAIKHRDKIQHAASPSADELLVGFEHRVERWRLPAPIGRLRRLRASQIEVCGRLEHPHLAGLHTVEPLDAGRAVLSCAAADAVLIADLERGTVERTLRLPASLYGRGYELLPEHDLRRHYVDDEQQSTHVNAATPIDGGRALVVSALIPGAVGIFDLDGGGYRELRRGLVGCHGARQDDAGRIYASASPQGELCFFDRRGTVARRYAVGSRWLHDAVQLSGDLYAFALADHNALEIHHLGSQRLLARRRYRSWPFERGFAVARRLTPWLGNSVQSLAFVPAGEG
ncbi:MAG: hypothetical protein D6696_10540 [Acidobacteria bacterium]|nr:MAG: hypothetical protein D6696_10540 [Acidobacteriota bacterium]